MKLDELASGAVYVDTNVWYMYLRTDPAHQQTLTTFLGRVVRGAIEAFVGILVLDELFYRLLLARVKDATGRNPLEVLRADLPGAIAAHGQAGKQSILMQEAMPGGHCKGCARSTRTSNESLYPPEVVFDQCRVAFCKACHCPSRRR